MLSTMLRRLGLPESAMRTVDHAGAACRRALARSPWWRALVVVAAMSAIGWSVLQVGAAARTERAGWGTSAEVWVAAGDHVAGEPLRAERRTLPVVAVPPSARLADPRGEIVRHVVAAGEVVVDADVVPGVGISALAPPGTVVVALADPLVPDAPIGAAVMVSTEGVVLSADGTVVAASDGVVFVAVPAAEAPMIAAAARQSLASLLLPALGSE